MARLVPEWTGATDDTPPPPRVKARIVERQGGVCSGPGCERTFGPALRPEFDHIVPLVLGGANRESNLQALCEFCHAAKTNVDVAIKSKVARVKKKHLGLETKRSRFPASRQGKWKQKIGGGVVRREED